MSDKALVTKNKFFFKNRKTSKVQNFSSRSFCFERVIA